MVSKSKANVEVERIFRLAQETALIPMPFPVYIDEVRFELLFFYFFLLDYRQFSTFDDDRRTKIFDEFIEQMSNEIAYDRPKDMANALYECRIGTYFHLINNSKTIGEFLTPASEYIEVMARYLQEKGYFSGATGSNIEEARREIPLEMLGLAKNIAISISMHSMGLL